MVSKSAEYYRSHPKAREKKKKYDAEFEKKPEQVKKRVELKRENREHDEKYGKASVDSALLAQYTLAQMAERKAQERAEKAAQKKEGKKKKY